MAAVNLTAAHGTAANSQAARAGGCWLKLEVPMSRCVLLVLLALSPAQTRAAVPPPAPLSTAEIARRGIPAVVLVKGTDGDGREISGSGFLVDPLGLVVTNLHVISQLRRATVRLSNGDVYDRLSIRSFDERRDLAVLKIPGFGLPIIGLGNSDSIQVGDPVALVGNPLQLEGSITTGVISGIRSLEDEGYRVIQTDAAANPGNSGGPLIDEHGRAIGVLTFKARGAENVNFVVPINYVRGMLADSAALSLDEVRSRLVGIQSVKQSAMLPNRWKSLASGTTKILRQDGDHLYVETVLSDELQKAGAFNVYELHRDSTNYKGVIRWHFPCARTDFWTNVVIGYSWCTEEVPVEITTLTPTRIEGVAQGHPQGDAVRCTTCTHSKRPEMQPFVWIPE